MQLILIPEERKPVEIYEDCWLIPETLNIEAQKKLMEKMREWCKGWVKYHQLPGGSITKNPMCCFGVDWQPYEYFQYADIEFPPYLEHLAYKGLTLIPGSSTSQYRKEWEKHKPDTAFNYWYLIDSFLSMHADNLEHPQLIKWGSPICNYAVGDDCDLRVGGLRREDRAKTIRMKSGDGFFMYGASRLRFHGVIRIYPDTAPLELEMKPGRFSTTIRRCRL